MCVPAIATNSQSSFGFVENRGQLRDDLGKPVPNVFYQSSFAGMALFVTTEGLTCVFHQRDKSREEEEAPKSHLSGNGEEGRRSKWRMDIKLVGGRISPPTLKGEMLIPGHQNHFAAHASEAIYGVRSFEQVRIGEVYPGIDWILKRDEKGRFKHEFEVAPGADASQIKLLYEGAQVEIGADGKTLALQTPLGNLEEGELMCYLKASGTQVEAVFQANGDLVSYQLPPYPENETLIIDPALELFWATRYGGGEIEGPTTMVVDKLFNLYVVGYTQSVNFPTLIPGEASIMIPIRFRALVLIRPSSPNFPKAGLVYGQLITIAHALKMPSSTPTTIFTSVEPLWMVFLPEIREGALITNPRLIWAIGLGWMVDWPGLPPMVYSNGLLLWVVVMLIRSILWPLMEQVDFMFPEIQAPQISHWSIPVEAPTTTAP